ncbi:MAG: hydrogenase expression/formation protein HypE [Clostridiales bacterium GWE2_32_10]|nr:MAG: hydrogenase expression/formation protein HypE [Clostridiales bacterium GWE2_32_10]HBY19763.1 hydrogenase expression/formation protein HypE [Clostridiales bacterium]
MNIITLEHGNGGEYTHELVRNLFYKHFQNELLMQQSDSSILGNIGGKLAVTTDSFVVDPIFFPGGDIGKLSICGTVNDLAVVGAKPLYITAGFIIEVGLRIDILERIIISMANTAKEANVKIVAGDTKVVGKGDVDKIYINTTGIGVIEDNTLYMNSSNIVEGDKVILSGTIGDHGMCVMSKRAEFDFDTDIESDCSLLHILVTDILEVSENVRIIRDPTRGGIATTLNEFIENTQMSIVLNEEYIPVRSNVKSMCKMIGLDPLYIANEGKIILIVSTKDAEKILEVMKRNKLGLESRIIGEVIGDNRNKVYLKTEIGGTRILNMLEGDLLPRIC